jgi:hypothetical protein
MPADEDGINVQADRGRSIDRGEVSRDIRRYGAALHSGDPAVITFIKKKGKHIEFQLDGGGWQGRRSASLRYFPAPKSDRHKDIEEELDLLPDPMDEDIPEKNRQLRLRRILEEDLEELTMEYDAVNAERLAAARENQAREQEYLNRSILEGGSRFNLRFDRNVPYEALTPEGLMAALGKYVDFSKQAVSEALSIRQQHAANKADEHTELTLYNEPEYEPASAETILKVLKKGLLWEDALALLGTPSGTEEFNEGRLRVKAGTFEGTELGTIEAEFVEDVLVYYSITSR